MLPVVFYTGTRPWQSPGVLTELMEGGEQFERITPLLEPLYLNLPALSAETLERTGGHFGHVLRLLQQRKARSSEFERLLEHVVRHLETVPDEQRLRWLELLSYVHAMVYHEREPAERDGLVRAIERSVQSDEHRREVLDMRQTIAEKLTEEGREEGELRSLRRTLLLQLRKRFGKQAETVAGVIERTDDARQLENWLERFATATTFQELGIGRNL